MDGNGWRPAQGDPNIDSNDWRTQFTPASRQRIVNKIMETLERHLPVSCPEGIVELKKIAVKFEENNYTAATNQPDYLRRIALKMLAMETKSQTNVPNSLPSNPAAGSQNQPNPASMDSTAQTGHSTPVDWQEGTYLKDMIVGGTDTSSIPMEWAMTELARHPHVMKKAQEEVRRVAGSKLEVEEGDLHQLEFLKSIIKETMRLHPPGPLLVPRESINDVEIQGYLIPAKSMVFINAWAIGRDPESWDRANEFLPERFMKSSIDFKGHDFQFIPFGAGRRGCPGTSFAVPVLELALANILHRFNWELPDGVRREDLDMSQGVGNVGHRKSPLMLLATPF